VTENIETQGAALSHEPAEHFNASESFVMHYAATAEGLRVPLVDVTDPAFAVRLSERELIELAERLVSESAARPAPSGELRAALERSVLGGGLMAAAGTFLNGTTTYLLKLGPDNLWADAGPVDRAIAASFPALSTRLRLHDVSRLLADGIARVMRADATGRPLWLLNIAGGAASDSWNALLRLQAAGISLRTRRIVITILDLEEAAPGFAARAVAALGELGAPLAGLDIHVDHVRYDWSNTATLTGLLEARKAERPICAVSSEGALFEYGSDAEIAANLDALRQTPPDAILAGSVTPDTPTARAAHRGSEVATRARTVDALRSLAAPSGWRVEETIERPLSHHFRAVKG
jgi:hypothetical protein